MLFIRITNNSQRLCLLFILSLHLSSIKCYLNDGRFGRHGYSVLPFDTDLHESLNGFENSMFPQSSKEELLMG